jgi:hypothetical protein
MLMIIIFFFLGVALGVVGLRLLVHWDQAATKPQIDRLHHR